MKYLRYILVLLLSISIIACDDDDETPAVNPAPSPETQTDPLSLLRGENNIGAIVGFNADNPQTTTDSIEARWQEARAAGMRSGKDPD